MARKKAVEHSAHFDKVKKYFDDGRWDEYRVHEAVIKEWITADEFAEIVGKPFEESAQ